MIFQLALATPQSLIKSHHQREQKIARVGSRGLRTFAPNATAHFSVHVTHTSCIADHEGKHNAKGANIFPTTMERKCMWHYGIAVDPGLLGNVTQWRDSANRQSL